MNFEQSLEIGHRAEEYILKKMKLVYPTMERIEGKNVHFDMQDSTGMTIEVKLDLKSKETNFVGIEYRHRGKPSGISISEAKRWVLIYYLPSKGGWGWTMIETRKLRQFIKRNVHLYSRIKGEGDKSSLVLVVNKDLADNFNFFPIENSL